MGGHKTYYFGDVSYKGSASPLHLEWIAMLDCIVGNIA